jgi:hypothetical protein
MIQIGYNNASFDLRLEFPATWDAQSISTLTLGIKDTAGNELLAPASVTLLSSATLDADVEVFDNTVVLAESRTLYPGDRLDIAFSADGPSEAVEILTFDSATDTLTLRRDLVYSHSSGSTVVPIYAVYALDTSDTTVYTLLDNARRLRQRSILLAILRRCSRPSIHVDIMQSNTPRNDWADCSNRPSISWDWS